MAANKCISRELTVEVLRKLIHYNPETGALTWLPRTPEFFVCKEQKPEHSCKIWNSANAGEPALSYLNPSGYLSGAIFGNSIRSHRAAWALYYGEWPKFDIDHINGDRADNRICNLRDVPCAINAKNQKRNARNTSGITGVSWFARTQKWVAMIKGDGKVRNLGYFFTIEEAAAARKAAECRYGFHPNHGRQAA